LDFFIHTVIILLRKNGFIDILTTLRNSEINQTPLDYVRNVKKRKTYRAECNATLINSSKNYFYTIRP